LWTDQIRSDLSIEPARRTGSNVQICSLCVVLTRFANGWAADLLICLELCDPLIRSTCCDLIELLNRLEPNDLNLKQISSNSAHLLWMFMRWMMIALSAVSMVAVRVFYRWLIYFVIQYLFYLFWKGCGKCFYNPFQIILRILYFKEKKLNRMFKNR
jgi:hypothetical protein